MRSPLSLHGLRFDELAARLQDDGVRPVHAGALWKVLYRDSPEDWNAASVPPPLRRWIDTHATDGMVDGTPVVTAVTSSTDGRTEKFLLRLTDGQEIETVIMGYPGRSTACLSTQAGCAMGCVFCATGQMGFARHLTASEIVSQAVHVRRVLAARGEHLRNVVLMGMGEPLHNYDPVMRALDIIRDPRGLAITPARITVNTVGIVPAIRRMAREQRPYNLGVSLHGSTDEERAALVPIAHRWPLDDLIAACREYSGATGRKIFFAWTLIDGVNDTVAHAARLAGLVGGLHAHVNLIRLNATAGYAGRSAADAAASAFRATIQAAGIPCTIRQRRGIDVAAGCGQLATNPVGRRP